MAHLHHVAHRATATETVDILVDRADHHVVEIAEQLAQPDIDQAGRRKLDRQRKAVEMGADPVDRLGHVGRIAELDAVGRRTITEQLRTDVHRRQRPHVLPLRAEPFPRRREDRETATPIEKTVYLLPGRLEDVLTVVDHEE